MKRRTAIQTSILIAGAGAPVLANSTPADGRAQDPKDEPQSIRNVEDKFSKSTFIATWKFGQVACEKSRTVLSQGGSLKDAVERGINVTELDESNRSVGYGGNPNAEGVVQLDACFMDGATQKAGSVAALEGYPNPVSVARRVMETTKHVMLAGEDAAAFAARNGFQPREMLTPGARAAWEKWKAQKEQSISPGPENHDTIALLGVDNESTVVGGCSTSGLAFKLPGRVGDSPIIGSGLYVDGEVGAAGATGVGENIMRYCGSFLIVEYMRQGKSPTDACIAAIRRIASGEKKPPSELSVNFVAINKDGVVGAAGTDKVFRCAIVDPKQSLVAMPEHVQ
ncbi:MAG: N(4)-(beta-N-acetylglucosaminyl)-L-asparaginase [Planctomycetota bacterium]